MAANTAAHALLADLDAVYAALTIRHGSRILTVRDKHIYLTDERGDVHVIYPDGDTELVLGIEEWSETLKYRVECWHVSQCSYPPPL